MTTSAQDALNDMTNQDFRQRLCLWIVIIALFILNIIVLVIMVNNGGKLYTTTESIVGFHDRRHHGQNIQYIPVSPSPRQQHVQTEAGVDDNTHENDDDMDNNYNDGFND